MVTLKFHYYSDVMYKLPVSVISTYFGLRYIVFFSVKKFSCKLMSLPLARSIFVRHDGHSFILFLPRIQQGGGLVTKTEAFGYDCEDEILLKFFSRILKNYTSRKASLYFFSPEKLARLFLLKEVKPSPDCKMIKIPTFDDFFPSLWHSHQNS